MGRLQGEMKSNIPSIHVDWFLAQASLPPLYHDLLSLPLTASELETRLGVDVSGNLQNAPGVRVWRAGFNNSGVSNNNRVVERHTSQHGAYWKSYDFAGSVGTQNIFNHPLDFTHDGGEVIFNLPNGLQGYYLVDASGAQLEAAPIKIVSNPAASDPTVRNGLSCFGCHTEGMKTFEDQVRSVIESTANPAYDKAQALRLYVEKSKMDTLVQEDMERYKDALEKTGGMFDDIEPISRFHEVFQGPVDVAYAAAVIGLETEAFLEQIRENVGLQNAGLLVLDSANGSVKRDAWTSSFGDVIFALNFPESFTPPTVITPPKPIPGAVVRIPDPNLRAAIAETLGKSPNTPITVEEMGRLKRLEAWNRGIRDLTGLQFATNLDELILGRWGEGNNQVSDLSPIAGLINLRVLICDNNPISDLSPIAGLVNLRRLRLYNNPVSNLSPVRGLKNLSSLDFQITSVSDLSPIAGLINLKSLDFNTANVSDLLPIAGLINLEFLAFPDNKVSDLSPIAGFINLKTLYFWGNNVSDISPIAGLFNLVTFGSWGNPITDLSPFAGLTKIEVIDVCGGKFSDLTPLAGLTNLRSLWLFSNGISDISSLAGLTGLTHLNLGHNEVSDISPLAGLTNLIWLNVAVNQISDFSPLDRLRGNLTTFLWHRNPGFPKGGPKIEGPWLWVVLPDTDLDSDIDLLSEASGGTVTEVEIATHGATEGKSVGTDVWTFHKLPTKGWRNIEDMLKREIRGGTIYGSVSLHSPRQQETTMYVGGEQGIKVWLNGVLIHQHNNRRWANDYSDFFPVTLQQGRNVLLVAIDTHSNGFFGVEPGTEYTVANPGVGYAFSKTPIHTGDTFTLDLRAENIFDLAGWQFDIAFDPTALEAVDVTEGNFLKTDSGSTFFQKGSIDNAAGKITGLSAARLSAQGVSGTGTLLQVRFRAKSAGETELALHKFQFGSTTGDNIPAGPHEVRFTVAEGLPTGDVNRDGIVSILDLILVAQQLGKRVPAGSAVDVNGDGVVSILDLIRVAQGIAGSPAAPAVGVKSADAAMIEAWIAQARLEDDGSLAFKQGIENLERLLASLIPKETALLANYPNPFNSET